MYVKKVNFHLYQIQKFARNVILRSKNTPQKQNLLNVKFAQQALLAHLPTSVRQWLLTTLFRCRQKLQSFELTHLHGTILSLVGMENQDSSFPSKLVQYLSSRLVNLHVRLTEFKVPLYHFLDVSENRSWNVFNIFGNFHNKYFLEKYSWTTGTQISDIFCKMVKKSRKLDSKKILKKKRRFIPVIEVLMFFLYFNFFSTLRDMSLYFLCIL